jgi:hypothetical protein
VPVVEDLSAWDVILRHELRCWTDDGDGARMQGRHVLLMSAWRRQRPFLPLDVNPSTVIGYSADYVIHKARASFEKEGIGGEFTTTTSFRVCFIGVMNS